MAPIDIVVLAVIGIAFVAVCVRIYRKGTCADCAQGGVCTGHCSNKKTCAALKGVDKIAEDLGMFDCGYGSCWYDRYVSNCRLAAQMKGIPHGVLRLSNAL